MQSLKNSLHDLMLSTPQPVVILTTIPRSSATPNSCRGITLSSFNFVSFSPPIISFCLNRPSRTLDIVLESKNFTINVLNGEMIKEANHYSTSKSQSEFPFPMETINFNEKEYLIFKNCNSSLICSMHSRNSVGDHDVFYGNVEEIVKLKESMPLLYYKSGFHTLP